MTDGHTNQTVQSVESSPERGITVEGITKGRKGRKGREGKEERCDQGLLAATCKMVHMVKKSPQVYKY